MESRIIHGDAATELAKIPSGAVELFVTSPPYNLRNSTGNGMKDGRGGKWSSAKLLNGYSEADDDNLPHDVYVSQQREVIAEMLRIIPPDGAIFYNHKWRVQSGLLQDRADIMQGFPVRQIIIWKRSGGINFNKGYFVPTYEVIYMIAKPKFKLAHGANSYGDVWEIQQERNNSHPAPFPLELPKRIISSTDCQVIADPYCGSGTTLLAAKQLRRGYIGIERNEDYYNSARLRVESWEYPNGG